MNNIYLQDVENRIANNPEKTRLLLSKYGVETPEPTLHDVAQAYRVNPNFLVEFFNTTDFEKNNNDKQTSGSAGWTNWVSAVGGALGGFATSFNGQQNAEQAAALEQEYLRTQQEQAKADAKKQSTILWIVGGVVVLLLIVGMFFMFGKK